MTIRRRMTVWAAVLVLGVGATLLGGAYLVVRANFPTGEARIVEDLSQRLAAAPAPGTLREAPAPVPAGVAEAQADAARDGASRTLWIFGLMLAGALLISVLAGRALADRMLRPLRRITATAHEIEGSSLHRRLALRGPPDEIGDLAATFDVMLDRLQRAFDAQRHFVGHAAHELRTPLAVAQARADAALADPAADLRAALLSVRGAIARSHALQEALLDLTRGEGGAIEHEVVDLAEVVSVAVADVGIADDVRLRVETQPAVVVGDLRLLVRLVTNLVDNAARYNEPRGWISVRATAGATLEVANSGPQMQDVDRLLAPFVRGEQSRSRATGGAGLGLAIVAAIAEAHRAELGIVARPNGGLVVTVQFLANLGP